MEILVVRAGALGDVVLTLPALRAIRERCPAARVTVAGYPALFSLAGDLVDRVESIDSARFSTLFSGSPAPGLREWLQSFDCAVAWTLRDPRPALRAAGVRTVIHASPYPPPGVHAADWLLQSLGLPQPRLPIETPGRHGDIVYLHPGAGAAWKRWPPEHFAQVIDRLVQRGVPVMLVEGPADAEVTRAVLAASPPVGVLREPDLPALADRLGEARLFIGNDSGVTHLAASRGVPTIALFGPTDPRSWAPRGDVTVLRHCGRDGTRQGEIRVCADDRCMESITVDEVVRAIDRIHRRNVDNSVDNLPAGVDNLWRGP